MTTDSAMENHRVLNLRKWLAIRKAQVIGAAIGFSLTMAMLIANIMYKHAGEGNQIDMFLLVAWGLLLFPTVQIGRIFGWKLQINMTVGQEATWAPPTIVAAIINAFLLVLIVTLIRSALTKYNNLRK